MDFVSVPFLFFFLPCSLLGYLLIRKINKTWVFLYLLLVSLLFYYLQNDKGIYILVLLFIIADAYVGGEIIKRTSGKIRPFVLTAFLLGDVGILFFFKYGNHLTSALQYIFKNGPEIKYYLPLGISFFTFRGISYLADVYWGITDEERSITKTALYISFFPQVCMGPIVKYVDFEDMCLNQCFSLDNIACGIKRIIIGLAKKLVIANTLAVTTNQCFQISYERIPVVSAWVVMISYALQLYLDFSGYSDMAIGIGNLFGFFCSENFDYPYLSASVSEFWRRWHISLGEWLKTYIYFPIFKTLLKRKNRNGKRMSKNLADGIALLVLWICCGIWHGSSKKFIIYGLYYFVFVLIERHLKTKESERKSILWHIYCLLVICFGHLLFKMPSMSEWFNYIKCMFGQMNNAFVGKSTFALIRDNIITISLGICCCFPVLNFVHKKITSYNKSLKIHGVYQMVSLCSLCALFIIDVSFLMANTYHEFIYFQF